MPGPPELLYEAGPGQIAVITLNRPERLNAMSPGLTTEFFEAIRRATGDSGVRVLILTGAGSSFSVGADLKAIQSTPSREPYPSDWPAPVAPLEMPRAVWCCPKPVIAAINGPAVGGGFGLALACDFRIAAESARLGAVQVKIGVMADSGIAYLLPRIVGPERALALMFSGEILTARKAEAMGIVSAVIPDDQLLGFAREYAEKLASGPPIAMGHMKHALHLGLAGTLNDVLEYEIENVKRCFATEDAREGVQAFLEKRQPRFTGHQRRIEYTAAERIAIEYAEKFALDDALFARMRRPYSDEQILAIAVCVGAWLTWAASPGSRA